jgi:DNA mismatch endonuclease (patch repair protein)
MFLRPTERVSRNLQAPAASSEAVRCRMRATKRRGTKAELRLHQALDNLGLRYATDKPAIPSILSRADLLFRSAQVAVFVDGCFWHQCPVHGTSPKTNRAWWTEKLKANRRRDTRNRRRLREAGWSVLRIWEHAALRSPEQAARAIANHVKRRLTIG